VPCKCSWNIKGKDGSLEANIPVKTDSFTGVDGMIGKAARKFYKRVYEVMTGILIHDPEEPEFQGETIENDEATINEGPSESTVQKPTVSEPGKQKEVDQNQGNGSKSNSDPNLFNE